MSSEVVVLRLLIDRVGDDGDTTIVLELDDFLVGEVVQEGVGLVQVLTRFLGELQLCLELFDLLESFGQSCILVVVDTFFLFVVQL